MTQKVGSDNSDDSDEEEIKDNVFRKTNFSKCIFQGGCLKQYSECLNSQ